MDDLPIDSSGNTVIDPESQLRLTLENFGRGELFVYADGTETNGDLPKTFVLS